MFVPVEVCRNHMLSFCQQDASLADASKRPQWWWLLILALVAIGVYANSVRNEFAFDDVGIVQDNDHVRNLDWVQIWSDNYWPLHNGVFPDVLYRPLTIWSYLANQALTPGASWAFHLTNVLLNALLVVMVALLAWRIFARRSVAILSALFFALHPIHVEVVANTVGRAEILAAIWSVAALLVFLPTTPLLLQTAPVRRSLWHGWLVAACFFAAMLCKETPVTVAAAFVLIDVWRWSSWPRDSRPSLFRWMARQAFRYYFPIAAAFGLYILMRIHAT